MAASIPMLRVLIQRNADSRPTRFIELVKSVSTPSGASGLKSKSTVEESWSEYPTAAGSGGPSGSESIVRLRGDVDVQRSYTWAAYGGTQAR
jgi:hypothetical protein